jgi:hypothetical protein
LAKYRNLLDIIRRDIRINKNITIFDSSESSDFNEFIVQVLNEKDNVDLEKCHSQVLIV